MAQTGDVGLEPLCHFEEMVAEVQRHIGVFVYAGLRSLAGFH